jgi:signal transduction histidine kinase
MSRLLEELLDLSRVGRKMNPLEDASLQSLVHDAMDLVAGQIAQRGVKIDVTDEVMVLHCDRARLVGVFQNLIDNAVKFMGNQAKPHVEIGVETTVDRGNGEPVVFVRDNGMGIDPRHQHRVFGLFEKIDPASSGTGMGRALVKRIVEAHGGRIWVESGGVGLGTTFRFTLARMRREASKETKA